jgi:hypothetical protein
MKEIEAGCQTNTRKPSQGRYKKHILGWRL